MATAPAVPYRKGGRTRPSTPKAPGWSYEGRTSIEIVAPDRYSTVLLLGYAPPLFDAEIVAGAEWMIRLKPPAGTGWMLELLALVERWLESARLPGARLHYEGRSFLIRAPADAAQPATTSAGDPLRERDI